MCKNMAEINLQTSAKTWLKSISKLLQTLLMNICWPLVFLAYLNSPKENLLSYRDRY